MECLSSTEENTRSAMLDPDVLNCPICVELFTIPIFQCDNGHLACSSCYPKLNNKCPSCASPLVYNRCRAMESVLEAISLPCGNAKLGCTITITFGKESTHEKECTFSRCSCPSLRCHYSGSYKDLYDHYDHKMGNTDNGSSYRKNRFACGISFTAKMNISDKVLTIRERNMKLLFVVQSFRELCDVYVIVSCIAPVIPEVGEFSYCLSYNTVDGDTLIHKSTKVRRILEVSFETPQKIFMLIPHSLLCGELLEMELCIKKKFNLCEWRKTEEDSFDLGMI